MTRSGMRRFTAGLPSLVAAAVLAACGGGESDTHPEGGTDAGLDGSKPDAAGADAASEASVPDDAERPDGGDPPAGDPAARSGSRLKLRFLEAGPGARQVRDFWDTELDQPCEFPVSSDAEPRCLPTGRTSVAFADAECTQPVIASGGRCDFRFGRDADGTFYERTSTAAEIPEEKIYAPSLSGECSEVSFDAEADYWVATEVSPERFVSGELRYEPRADGMASQYVDGADGSSMLQRTLYREGGSRCHFFIEAGHCVSGTTAGVGYFRDESCTEPVAFMSVDRAPDHVMSSQRDGCERDDTYYEVGEELDPEVDLFELDSSEDCVPYSRSDSETYYAMGDELPPSELPRVNVEREGTGRVQAARRVDADGEPLGVAFEFWDGERDIGCMPMRFSDGSTRCVPNEGGYVRENMYADAECEGSQLAVYSCRPPSAYVVDFGGHCPTDEAVGVDAVYERGTAYEEAAAYFQDSEGACTSRDVSELSDHFLVGDEVAAAEFPELEVVIE